MCLLDRLPNTLLSLLSLDCLCWGKSCVCDTFAKHQEKLHHLSVKIKRKYVIILIHGLIADSVFHSIVVVTIIIIQYMSGFVLSRLVCCVEWTMIRETSRDWPSQNHHHHHMIFIHPNWGEKHIDKPKPWPPPQSHRWQSFLTKSEQKYHWNNRKVQLIFYNVGVNWCHHHHCPDHQVRRRLQGQKEADLRRLTITEVDERSSPESPEVRSRSRFTHSHFPNFNAPDTTRVVATIDDDEDLLIPIFQTLM